MCNIPGGNLFRGRTSGGTTSGTLAVTVTFNQGIVDPAVAAGSGSSSTTSSSVSPVEGSTLFNTSTASVANTAVTTSIAGLAGTRVHLYGVTAYCAAGTASITIKDGV